MVEKTVKLEDFIYSCTNQLHVFETHPQNTGDVDSNGPIGGAVYS